MNIAQEKLKIPAIIILVIAILTILLQIFSLISNLFLDSAASAQMVAENIADPQMRELYMTMMGGQGPAGIAMGIFSLLLNGFVIFGALQMKDAKNYGVALATAIIYIIPCFSACCIGFPFGIWALVLLLKDDVKQAFNQGAA